MNSLEQLSKILDTLGFGDADPLIVSVLQSIIFASDAPLQLSKIKAALPDKDPEAIEKALSAVFMLHEATGIRLNRSAGGYLFTTAPENSVPVRALTGGRIGKLSRPALESLAITAWLGPVTQVQINQIRGVNSDSSIKYLLDKGLIRTVGRKDEPGRAILYSTTREFLTFFGLESLSELPKISKDDDSTITRERTSAMESFKGFLEIAYTPDEDELDFSRYFEKINKNNNIVEIMRERVMKSLGIEPRPATKDTKE
jgi:segregation and condensation protein B